MELSTERREQQLTGAVKRLRARWPTIPSENAREIATAVLEAGDEVPDQAREWANSVCIAVARYLRAVPYDADLTTPEARIARRNLRESYGLFEP